MSHIVLARKTRPQILDDLRGQDVLVRTLKNAITAEKIAHGYIFTGIRGVGKTSTARILAKSLNCLGEDGKRTTPTIKPCGVCDNCKSISESRHMDVIELDAASHTGVENMRSILEESVYRPVSARYKIYIIDEVHMLSSNAFNAMLKTLEEPPEHVLFILATTELQKVPITILSRCQRFNLPRIPVETLKKYYTDVSKKENISIDEEALHIISREADGSARDGMSLLEQAVALSNGENITTEKLIEMIGRTTGETVRTLFDSLVQNNVEEALKLTSHFIAQGGSAKALIADMLEFVYQLTQVKADENSVENLTANPAEKEHLISRAKKFSYVVLARLWQLFLKGMSDLKISQNSHATLDMLCVRIAYLSSEMISPSDKKTSITAGKTIKAEEKEPESFPQQEELKIEKIEDVCKALCAKKEMILASVLQNEAKIDSFEKGKIVLQIKENAKDIQKRLATFLRELTKENWIIELIEESDRATLSEEKIKKA
ncbi:MAG: DNA polymerase III subunit gamma/tau, partial [Alphaproteobacteria bacterium]